MAPKSEIRSWETKRKRERTKNTYRIYIRLSFTISPTCVLCMESLVLRSKTLDGKCAGELVKCDDDFAFINFVKMGFLLKILALYIFWFNLCIYSWSLVEILLLWCKSLDPDEFDSMTHLLKQLIYNLYT